MTMQEQLWLGSRDPARPVHGGQRPRVFTRFGLSHDFVGAVLSGRPSPRAAAVLEASHAAASAGFLTGLEHSGQAAAILDKGGRVISMNARGEKHLGDTILLRSGRLCATSRDADARLQRFIGRLISPIAQAGSDPIELAVLPQAEGLPLFVRGTVMAFEGTDFFPDAKALVTFTKIGHGTVPSATLLCDLFGLTVAEAGVALGIARGADLRDIASLKGVSVQTVKSHLKAVFAKTNTRRQVALAVLITRIQSIWHPDN